MNKKNPYQVLDEIAQAYIGSDINVSSNIHAKINKEKTHIMKTKRFITGAVAITFVVIILISIPSVAKAMKRLLGYVPNVGIIEQNTPLWVLEESVQITEGETSITVTQAVIDSEHTTILYQVENITVGIPTQNLQPKDLCNELPWLQLSDGTQLFGKMITGDSWSSGYSRHLEFSTLPNLENRATLVFPCLEQTPVQSEMKPWELPLSFIEASPQMTVFPIIDIPTPTPAAAGLSDESPSQNELTPASQISFSISKYIQTDEEIILFGALNTESTDFRIQYVDENEVHFKDANGNEIPLIQDYSLSDPEVNKLNDQSLLLTYRSSEKYTPGPAVLSINNLWIGLTETAVFSFDPGLNPQPGQKWNLNESLEISGYNILIKDVTLNDSADGLTFNIQIPEEISEISLMDFEHPILGGGGPGNYGFTYQDGLPSGIIQITLLGLSVNLHGPWQTTIDLPVYTDNSLSAQTQQACLTQSSWQSAVENQTTAYPEGLGGTLVYSNYSEPDYLYHVRTSALDGSNNTDIGLGREGSISPDKQQVVYTGDDGLKLINLSTGLITPVPGTDNRDQEPLWSFDGKKIVFTRKVSGINGALGPYSLMLLDMDSLSISALLENADANLAQAWLPNSTDLIYTVKGPEGASVFIINIETSSTKYLFDLNYLNAGVAISHNGKRLAFEEKLPGEQYVIYIADMDGGNQKLIADAEPIVVSNPQWSPDNQWLIVSVQDTSLSSEIPVLALIQADTCQIIPLVSLKGYVTSWK